MNQRYVATFHPQAWVRDHAIEVDPQGPTEWDVTETLLAMSDDERRRSMVADRYESDDLRHSPTAPQWVRDWRGPFYIEVETK